MVYFCFFKQKTAYELRISDWSSTCALPIWRIRVGQSSSHAAPGRAPAVRARPIFLGGKTERRHREIGGGEMREDRVIAGELLGGRQADDDIIDRKSTRLNSSH